MTDEPKDDTRGTDARVLLTWLREIPTWGNTDKIQVLEDGPATVRVHLFTATHRYAILAKAPAEPYPGYLGCTAMASAWRPGEDWHRGNDLPDGPLTKEIFDQIVRAIVGYELVAVRQMAAPAMMETPIP